jgi:hypothetical protein
MLSMLTFVLSISTVVGQFNDSISQKTDTLEWKLDNVIEGDFDFFNVDLIGNVYTVKGDVLKKFNASGDELFRQSVKFFGEITSMDVGQSFKPVLFYKDQQSIIYLDNTLSQNAEIQLEEKGIYLAQLVALSYTQNTTWIYDQANTSLSKYDVNFNQISTVENLAQQLNQEFDPTFLKEYNDLLYMNNPEEGVLVFDLFGTFVKTLLIKDATYLDLDNNHLFYVKGEQLYVYNQKTLNETKISIPVKSLKGFGVSKDRFYFHDKEGVKVYLR